MLWLSRRECYDLGQNVIQGMLMIDRILHKTHDFLGMKAIPAYCLKSTIGYVFSKVQHLIALFYPCLL